LTLTKINKTNVYHAGMPCGNEKRQVPLEVGAR